MRIPPEPLSFRSVAEQQMQRAVNATPSRATKVRVLPLRPAFAVRSDHAGLVKEDDLPAIERAAAGRPFFHADLVERETRRPEEPMGASP